MKFGLLLLVIPFIIFTSCEFLETEKCPENWQTECNGKCWTNDCEPGRMFVCDPIKGGLCDHDPTACEAAGRHSCQGTCWPGCPAGYQFICDDEQGGVCKEY